MINYFFINGECWKVFCVPPNSYRLLNNDGSYSLGCCNDFTKSIYINKDLKQNKSRMYKVLCHEIVHSIIFSYDILLNAYQEEVLANIVATYGKYIINIANRICSQI